MPKQNHNRSWLKFHYERLNLTPAQQFFEYAIRRRKALRVIALTLAIWTGLFASSQGRSSVDTAHRFSSTDCATCHSRGDRTVTPESLRGSVHEGLACTDCHSGIEGLPHSERLPAVDCDSCHEAESTAWRKSPHAVRPGAPACVGCHGTHLIQRIRGVSNAALKLQIAELCRRCHSQEYAHYKLSVHAKTLERGYGQAATCTDCHGEHSIRGPETAGSPVAPISIAATCGSCHADKKTMASFGLPTDRVSTFNSSFHATALAMGDPNAATCASCHGAHDILASADPASRTSPANLPKTCGRCHVGVKQGFAGVKIHVDVSPTGVRSAWYVRIFYIAFITILVLGFILHILAERLGAFRNRKAPIHNGPHGKRGTP